ncbi:MAG: hypothetical protein IH874_03855 [Candidatus Dadabacteria bacterium]|nr:hypothetical protein [Candidatus Dadabacteria bacterium]
MADIQSLKLKVTVDAKQLSALSEGFSKLEKSVVTAFDKAEKVVVSRLDKSIERLDASIDPHSPVLYNSIMDEEHNAKEKTEIKPEKVCANCGHAGSEKDFRKPVHTAWIVIELFFWGSTIFYLISSDIVGFGVLFIWSVAFSGLLHGRAPKCPVCEAKNPIPADSPRGIEIVKESDKQP